MGCPQGHDVNGAISSVLVTQNVGRALVLLHFEGSLAGGDALADEVGNALMPKSNALHFALDIVNGQRGLSGGRVK